MVNGASDCMMVTWPGCGSASLHPLRAQKLLKPIAVPRTSTLTLRMSLLQCAGIRFAAIQKDIRVNTSTALSTSVAYPQALHFRYASAPR
jgi:hypothetical protein